MEAEPHFEDFRSLRRKIFEWQGERAPLPLRRCARARVRRRCAALLLDAPRTAAARQTPRAPPAPLQTGRLSTPWSTCPPS